ncbi:MAG: hypothetical protein FDX18_02630 [Chlorobium sp.]|nr:MAG: hypothetical protein FDX18_02630 [Chlorobium sp.]
MAETENKNNKSGFLEEDSGARSSMRLMSLISLGAAIMFGFLTLYISLEKGQADSNGIILTGMFLVGAFAPKAVQKFAEQKIGPINKESDPQ